MSIRVGEYGFTLRDTLVREGVAQDISSATSRVIKIQDPDGNTVSKSASFSDDGTDGQMEYFVDSGSLFDQAGAWKYQSFATDDAGFQWIGKQQTLVVEPAL